MLAGRYMNLCVAAIQKDHRQRTALYVLQDILTTYPGTVSTAVRPTLTFLLRGSRYSGRWRCHGACLSLHSTHEPTSLQTPALAGAGSSLRRLRISRSCGVPRGFRRLSTCQTQECQARPGSFCPLGSIVRGVQWLDGALPPGG